MAKMRPSYWSYSIYMVMAGEDVHLSLPQIPRIENSGNALSPPFCWTKFPKKVAKFETKFPKFSPKFAPKFAPKFFGLSWLVEKSSPKISPDFSHQKFQMSNRIPNQISPKISQTHFCRLAAQWECVSLATALQCCSGVRGGSLRHF